ncbi:hypothetical protein D1164_10995 [Mariniphaga sediminis]|uniref:Uncharacterized protein n=1 Tax=Mariniphaga sediminis TaxID=1628158 RepID=A0A399CZC0_9BACT|nr:hypothetical protein [Mariniphaga sediminis]RIH65105.1 hypothetical protein D1164_10995 [Mariniphaga sediminis]
MNKKEFYNNLIKAVNKVYPFTKEMVINKLPEQFKFIVKISSNFRDGLEDGEITFPEVEKLNQTSKPIEAEEVIDLLWMEYAIPEWINVQIENADDKFTYFSLECCGRYSKLEKHWYHKQEGYSPFHSLSPAIPNDSINENGDIIKKFDLNWNKK